ncbi:single-stranded DNA-binding protein [Metamycoplasma spumans]|uniref:single-stranded DNA-binding protein n=1 Tax=Metamycoplasma spumans TaxID=92406 RepID=UPI0004802184
MNKVILVGRLSSAPYKGETASKVEYSRFTIAVGRQYNSINGESVTDFIPCIAWRFQAAFVNKYLDKGSHVLVEGSFQSSRVIGQDGPTNVYVVNVERVQSLESRGVSEERRKNSSSTEYSIPQSSEEKNQSFDNEEVANISSDDLQLEW